jgi:hypothetical protein
MILQSSGVLPKVQVFIAHRRLPMGKKKKNSVFSVALW